MNDTPTPLLRNPATHQRHRQDVLLQITLPLIVGGGVLLGVIVAIIVAAANGFGELERWQAISLIWLLCPQILLSLLCLGAFSGMAFGVIKLVGWLPGFAYKVQNFFWLLRDKTKQFSDAAAKPFIKAGGISAGARALLNRKK